jgi:hypothetical protein
MNSDQLNIRPSELSLGMTNIRGTIAPLVVSPKIACRMLDCGLTRLYELLARRELQSFADGRARKIIIVSIEDFISRRLAASGSGQMRADLVEPAVRARRQRRSRRRVSGDVAVVIDAIKADIGQQSNR